ncbi:hypothetical protein N7448_011172 [Penicillium atrosanguineum]|nr:hypothetical protein N7448_011172 [Penicillium atrosanguineum]
MSLLSLPSELILLITRHLDSPRDHFSLLQSSRSLHRLLLCDLYRKNVKDDGGSALVWYASNGYEDGARNMLAAGANINLRGPNRLQSTALIEAVTHKHTSIVQMLLDNGALPDARSNHSKRALIIATAGKSNIVITELLLQYGAKVNIMKGDRHAPLLEAIRSNQEAKVAILLKHGAKPVISDDQSTRYILHFAAARNATPGILKMLINTGIDIDSQDGRGRTPLQIAAAHSRTRAVRRLLDYGATVNFKCMYGNEKGWTALFYAAAPKNPSLNTTTIIRTLLVHGADIDCRSEELQTPLHLAISRRANSQARELVLSGASIGARNSEGETLLHVATLTGTRHRDLTQWLGQIGADVNVAGGKQHETPIFYAIRGFSHPQNLEKVRQLLYLGADVRLQNANGLTPLSLAVHLCSLEITKILLEHGSRVNSRDKQGKSSIHHLVETYYGNPRKAHDIVELLIQHGADVNLRDNSGCTPLHGVAIKDWTLRPLWQVAGALMKAGADRPAITEDGRTPFDMVPDGACAETQRSFLRSLDENTL